MIIWCKFYILHVAIQIAWKRLLICVIQSLGYSVTFYLASEQFYTILLNGWNHNNWWPWGCLSFAESFLNVLQTLYWHSNCCCKYSTFSAIQKSLLIVDCLYLLIFRGCSSPHTQWICFIFNVLWEESPTKRVGNVFWQFFSVHAWFSCIILKSSAIDRWDIHYRWEVQELSVFSLAIAEQSNWQKTKVLCNAKSQQSITSK